MTNIHRRNSKQINSSFKLFEIFELIEIITINMVEKCQIK